MNSTSDNCAVKIAVRERPVRESLKNSTETRVVSYHPNSNVLIVDERPFTFDYVLAPSVTQTQVFDELIRPLVSQFLKGFNCTALAYGQTGTGKSYTMGLDCLESINFDGDNIGVIPRCLKEIFSANEDIENDCGPPQKRELYASFIEIYNEKVYDLLAENYSEPIPAKGFRYTGGSRKLLANIQDCNAILMQGNKNRHVRPTKMNSQSSRSHAIFTIHLRRITVSNGGEDTIRSSCMNIVDLAGSEGVRRTGHQGMAMSEGVNINQGLLSIGKVLQAMTMGSKVIPYRDSVLSSVLQDSLNPNSYLTLLACISPHREDLSETLSTLRFAQNAKQLKNTPQINNIIADIKKNAAKARQTPFKAKPLQVTNVNNKNTPLKRTYGYSTAAPKSAFKSNTFCTPKKQKVETNRCNQTDIISNGANRPPKLSNIAMHLPNMGQLESTHNRESLFNRSLDSNGSILSLNVSSSTSVDGAVNKKSNNPVFRKYMTDIEKGLEKKIMDMLQRTLTTLIPPQTPAQPPPSATETPLTLNVRREIKSIMKEVLMEEETPAKQSAKCQLFENSADLFKIPEVPEDMPAPAKTSSPNPENHRTSFTETFFAGLANSDKQDLNKSIRRSRRISQRFGVEQSIIENNLNNPHNETQQRTRRSTRRSILQNYTERRKSIRLATLSENPGEMQQPTIKTTKTNKKTTATKINNSIISSYCNSSFNNIKSNISKHRKALLELLNKGSMKEIQILPLIGQKKAFQIVTQRTLNGKFKSWNQVEKLPIWRGSEWERFSGANCLA